MSCLYVGNKKTTLHNKDTGGKKFVGTSKPPKPVMGIDGSFDINLMCQFKIMKWAVAKFPSIKLKIMGESVPTLLDSGSMVSVVWQDHFNRYFRPQLGPAEGLVANVHHMFNLTSTIGGGIPLSRYVELDVEFLGLQASRVRFLII